jgi:hypothetical protein
MEGFPKGKRKVRQVNQLSCNRCIPSVAPATNLGHKQPASYQGGPSPESMSCRDWQRIRHGLTARTVVVAGSVGFLI